MLATAGLVTVAFAAVAVVARRASSSPMGRLLGTAFDSWADASRHGSDLRRV